MCLVECIMESLTEIFGKQKTSKNHSKKIDELYRQIGEVTVERDWLKKKLEAFP